MQFRGAFTALVTPFRNGEVDEESYRRHIEWQIEQGIDGLVPCGTTGESATLSHAEHGKVIRICVEQVNKRVPVLAGAGSNNTREAVELTRYAKDAGADGALLITPYYNKPTQEGLVAHFKAIAKEVPMPFVVYNVPGRTALNLLPATVARMAREIPEVIGIKEATGDLKQVSEVVEFCPQPSPCSRATTSRCCRSWPWADTGSSPWSPTSPPPRCPTCARPSSPGTWSPPRSCTTR